MPPLNLLLNIPHEVTEADRTFLLDACPDLRIQIAPAADLEKPDQIDGRNAEVLVTEFVPRELSAWPNLKFVQLVSAGIDHLIGHPIWERGIPVANASGTHSVPMAQFATAAVLSLAHRLQTVAEFSTTRVWPNRSALAGHLVRGQTVGILGYGSIGRECARQLHALGMRVVCASRDSRRLSDRRFLAWPGTGDPQGEIPEQWFTPDKLHEMLPLCDVLLVSAPRTRASRGMVGAQQLALLRPKALVVIISRGGIVDEEALARALHAGRVGGAWVDTFLEEPLPPGNPLYDAPNAILTPHMSGVFEEYWVIIFQLLSENLRRFRAGQPLLNIASAERGY